MQMLKKMFDMSMIESRLQDMVDRKVAELLQDKQKDISSLDQSEEILKTPTPKDDTSKGKGVSFTAGFGNSTSAWLPKIVEDDESDGREVDAGKPSTAVKAVDPLDMSSLHKLIAEVRSMG